MRVQKNVVSQLEVQLRKEKDILQAMLNHLDISNQLITTMENNNKLHSPLLSQTTRHHHYMQNPPSVQVNNHNSVPVRSPILNSPNIGPMRRRITDKSLALAGGKLFRLQF